MSDTPDGRDGAVLADTSLFVALEQRRPLAGEIPKRLAVSVITVGELWLGVLAAIDTPSRAQRLQTLSFASGFDPLPVDGPVAQAWATMRQELRDTGRRMPLNDSWIAATAIANGLPVASQDGDYDAVPGLRVVRL